VSTLRVTLDSLADMGSPPVDGAEPGTALTATIYAVPSVGAGSVLDQAGGLHLPDTETVSVTAPWSYDLTDPTDADPTGWGWTVTIRGRRDVVAVLTPEHIAATPVVAGVRTMRLEDWTQLGPVLSTGMVTAGAAGVAADQAAVSAAAAALSAVAAQDSADRLGREVPVHRLPAVPVW